MSMKHYTSNVGSGRFRRPTTYTSLLPGIWTLPAITSAQTNQLSGRFVDQQQTTLVGVPVTLMAQTDTVRKQYVLTNTNGFRQILPINGTDHSPANAISSTPCRT